MANQVLCNEFNSTQLIFPTVCELLLDDRVDALIVLFLEILIRILNLVVFGHVIDRSTESNPNPRALLIIVSDITRENGIDELCVSQKLGIVELYQAEVQDGEERIRIDLLLDVRVLVVRVGHVILINTLGMLTKYGTSQMISLSFDICSNFPIGQFVFSIRRS